MQQYLITVFLPNGQELKYKVNHFEKRDNRILFIDRVNEQPKDFPAEICIIEGVKQ